MSFHAVLWAFEQNLPPATKLVLAVIGSRMNPKTNDCFPKIKTIAREASMDPRTVHRHNKVLVRRGFIEIENVYQGKGRRPNNYRLNCPPDVRGAPSDSADVRPSDTRVGDKKNHYSNHNNRARQEAENALAEMLGPNGWLGVLTTCSERVPVLIGKLHRGTLKRATSGPSRALHFEGGQPMKITVPSSDVARVGISHPAVAVAAASKSWVDKVDMVDSQPGRLGYPGVDLRHFGVALPHGVSRTDFLARPNLIFFSVKPGAVKTLAPSRSGPAA